MMKEIGEEEGERVWEEGDLLLCCDLLFWFGSVRFRPT